MGMGILSFLWEFYADSVGILWGFLEIECIITEPIPI